MEEKNQAAADLLTIGSFLLVGVLAGANFVAVRFTLQDLAPFWGAAVRFLPVSALLFTVCLLRRVTLPRGGSLAGAILYGMLNFAGYFAFAYWALQRVQAGSAALVTSIVPLLTLLLARVHGLEKVRMRGLVGASLAVVGIVVLQRESDVGAIPVVSLLAFVAAAACGAEALVVLKLFRLADPLSTNAVGMGVGGLVLLFLSFLFHEPRSQPQTAESWIVLAYLLTLGTLLLFAAQVFMVRRWTASASSYVFVLIPVFAATFGILLAGERPSPSLLMGGALILSGVFVGSLLRPR